MNSDALNSDAADRLRNWADDYVTGTLSPTDREALECELLTSEEARRFFVSYLELHAGLAWQFRGADCELPVLNEVNLSEANLSQANPTPVSTSRRWRWSLSSAAAVLVVAVTAWFWLHEPPREPAVNTEPVFAVVRETGGAGRARVRP